MAESNLSDSLSTVAITSDSSTPGRNNKSPGLIVLSTVFFAIAIISTVANLLVLLSYKYEKKLRNTFAILIGNLAVTDLIVSCFPMFFYTINILYQYWPLGRVLCGIWVVVDYNSVFASSYMLAAISIDRLWSIKWSIHYRNHNTKKKAALIVIFVWLLVFAIAMYPTITDRVLRTRDYYCHFIPSENPQFVIALAFLGHHIPCCIIVVCYIIVFVEIRKLFKTRPEDRAAARAKTKQPPVSRATVNMEPTVAASDEVPGTSKDAGIKAPEKASSRAVNNGQDNAKDGTAITDSDKKTDEKKEQKQQAVQQQQQQQRQATTVTCDVKTRADRERKSFITLSYIVIGYVICWVPFHFVYDVSFIDPDLVPEDLFTFTFWLTYVNSTINPFLYAFSSADLRNAVKKMFLCKCK